MVNSLYLLDLFLSITNHGCKIKNSFYLIVCFVYYVSRHIKASIVDSKKFVWYNTINKREESSKIMFLSAKLNNNNNNNALTHKFYGFLFVVV